MPKGIPKNGINKGWFKKGQGFWTGKKRPDMIGNSWNVGKPSWNKGLTGYLLPSRDNPSGEKAYHWKGGIHKRKDGYIEQRVGNHYLLQHRLVAQATSGQILHHINENRSDNNPENLQIFDSIGEHIKHHWEMGSYSKRTR